MPLINYKILDVTQMFRDSVPLSVKWGGVMLLSHSYHKRKIRKWNVKNVKCYKHTLQLWLYKDNARHFYFHFISLLLHLFLVALFTSLPKSYREYATFRLNSFPIVAKYDEVQRSQKECGMSGSSEVLFIKSNC